MARRSISLLVLALLLLSSRRPTVDAALTPMAVLAQRHRSSSSSSTSSNASSPQEKGAVITFPPTLTSSSSSGSTASVSTVHRHIPSPRTEYGRPIAIASGLEANETMRLHHKIKRLKSMKQYVLLTVLPIVGLCCFAMLCVCLQASTPDERAKEAATERESRSETPVPKTTLEADNERVKDSYYRPSHRRTSYDERITWASTSRSASGGGPRSQKIKSVTWQDERASRNMPMRARGPGYQSRRRRRLRGSLAPTRTRSRTYMTSPLYRRRESMGARLCRQTVVSERLSEQPYCLSDSTSMSDVKSTASSSVLSSSSPTTETISNNSRDSASEYSLSLTFSLLTADDSERLRSALAYVEHSSTKDGARDSAIAPPEPKKNDEATGDQGEGVDSATVLTTKRTLKRCSSSMLSFWQAVHDGTDTDDGESVDMSEVPSSACLDVECDDLSDRTTREIDFDEFTF